MGLTVNTSVSILCPQVGMSSSSDTRVANGNQGSSYLYDYGTSPNTRTAVSQKVRLLAPVFGASTPLPLPDGCGVLVLPGSLLPHGG